MNIDLSTIVSRLGDTAITEIGETLGLDAELSKKAAMALAENFTGDSKQAVAAAAKETGIGAEVLESMLGKLVETGKDMAMDAVKEQASTAAKGLFSRLLGRA
jgi:hypothetical protein